MGQIFLKKVLGYLPGPARHNGLEELLWLAPERLPILNQSPLALNLEVTQAPDLNQGKP
jgi:hypothetical protein